MVAMSLGIFGHNLHLRKLRGGVEGAGFDPWVQISRYPDPMRLALLGYVKHSIKTSRLHTIQSTTGGA